MWPHSGRRPAGTTRRLWKHMPIPGNDELDGCRGRMTHEQRTRGPGRRPRRRTGGSGGRPPRPRRDQAHPPRHRARAWRVETVEKVRRAVSHAIGECVAAGTPAAEMVTAMRGVAHLGLIFLRPGEPEDRRMTLMEAGMFLLAVGADTAIYGADRFLGFDLDEETPDERVRLREDPEAVEAIVTAVVTRKEYRGHARPYHHGRAGVTFDDEIELPGSEVAAAMPDHLHWILEHRPALPASPDRCLKFLSARGHGILLGRTRGPS
jgi:hypothetical protein